MRRRCSLICDVTGTEKSWSWHIIHRNQFNESLTTGFPVPGELAPEEVCRSFYDNLTGADMFQLTALGASLFNTIFPEQLRSEFSKYIGGDILFRIPSEWADIPFELSYEQSLGFLGTVFQIGTIIYFPTDHTQRGTARNSLKKYTVNKVVILADPAGNLPSAHTEGMQLKEYIKKQGIIAHFIAQGTRQKILDSMAQASCVHFAGHSHADDNTSGWEIQQETYLTTDDIGSLAKNPAVPWLIFSNSCHGGRCSNSSHLSGIAGAFLNAGIPQFIGPIDRVNDSEASAYAFSFYQHLFKKRFLLKRILPAQILLGTRRKMLKQNPHLVTPLFYRLFGDPCHAAYITIPRWQIWIKHRYNALLLILIGIILTGSVFFRHQIRNCVTALLPKIVKYALPGYLERTIAARSEEFWQERIAAYTRQDLYIDHANAALLTKNRSAVKGKYLIFPELQFARSFTDKRDNEYYYYHVPHSLNVFVIKYKKDINEKPVRYTTVVGNVSDVQCQFLGKITDAFITEHGTDTEIGAVIGNVSAGESHVIMMDITCVRLIGKAVVYIDRDGAHLIGEELITEKLSILEQNRYKGIPKQVTSLPERLPPLTVAKLFFYSSSEEKNRGLWTQCISDSVISSSDLPRLWWYRLSSMGTTCFYVRTAVDAETNKEYFFQAKQDGSYLNEPKSVSVILEQGEWKVSSVIP